MLAIGERRTVKGLDGWEDRWKWHLPAEGSRTGEYVEVLCGGGILHPTSQQQPDEAICSDCKAVTAGQRARPGDVLVGNGGRVGHIITEVDGLTARTACRETVLWSRLGPEKSKQDNSWIAPPGTRICATCRARANTTTAYRDMPEVVARASFGQPFVPQSVPPGSRYGQ
jgi:hypothetical protein